MKPASKEGRLIKAPIALQIATRIHTATLTLVIVSLWSLFALSQESCLIAGSIPFLFLIVLLAVAQWRGTFQGSQTGAMVSGLYQFLFFLVTFALSLIQVFLLFVWLWAPLILLGSLLMAYAWYWMAWQNWVHVQRLRGVEEAALPLPRTLSMTQLMLVMVAVSIICGLAAMVKHSAE